MSVSIARYLKDFSEPQGSALALSVDEGSEDMFADTGVSDPFATHTVVDLEEERRVAWAAGYEAAMQELAEKAASERAELVAQHEAAIADVEARNAEATAERILSGLRNSADAVATAISEEVAKVLGPVLDEEVTQRAVSSLADAIRAAMPDGDAVTLVVHGPRALFERLEAEPGMHATMKFVENDDIDLVVEIADSVLVTRLSAWSASLGKVLE